MKQIQHFIDYLSERLPLAVLRKDPNTSYLFGIYRSIKENPVGNKLDIYPNGLNSSQHFLRGLRLNLLRHLGTRSDLDLYLLRLRLGLLASKTVSTPAS